MTVHSTIGTDHVVGYHAKLTPHYNAPENQSKRRGSNDNNNKSLSSSLQQRNITAIGFQQQTSRQLKSMYRHVQNCNTREFDIAHREYQSQIYYHNLQIRNQVQHYYSDKIISYHHYHRLSRRMIIMMMILHQQLLYHVLLWIVRNT